MPKAAAVADGCCDRLTLAGASRRQRRNRFAYPVENLKPTTITCGGYAQQRLASCRLRLNQTIAILADILVNDNNTRVVGQ